MWRRRWRRSSGTPVFLTWGLTRGRGIPPVFEDMEFGRREFHIRWRRRPVARGTPYRSDYRAAQAGIFARVGRTVLRGGGGDDLSVDRPTLQNFVEESGRELAAQIATDILIIEDELLIALDLEHLVESLGHRITGSRVPEPRQSRSQGKTSRPYLGGYSIGGRKFGPGGGQRIARFVYSAGDLHYRLSGPILDWSTAGTGVFDLQAL